MIMKIELLMGNVTKNYLYTFFFNLNLTRGIWMIYLAGRGFSLLQLGIFEGVFHITSFLMEVPTGATADIWGRKASRLWGRVLFFASLFIMLFSRSFFIQLSGFVLCATGYNLESGAGEAFVYDSMLLSGRHEDYKATAGKQNLVMQSAFIAAYILGGYLAVRSYYAVYVFSIIFTVLSFITALFFIEPVISTEKKDKSFSFSNIKNSMYRQTGESILVIKKQPRIAFLIIFSELIFTFITSLFFYLQNYWKGNGVSEFSIGITFAVSALAAGLTAYKASVIEKIIGEKGVLLLMPTALLVCLWGISSTPYKAQFYVLTGVIDGILAVAVSDYINRLIPSENRATVLSFQSMAFSFFMIIFFPLIGWTGDRYSLDKAFLMLSVSGTAITFFYLLFFRKIIVEKK